MIRYHALFSLPLLLALGCRTDNELNPSDSGPDNPDNATDADGDGVTEDEDCDDADPSIYPGADEVCDDADNDCDDEVDEDATDAGTFYTDSDGDGFGDAASAVTSCSQPEGTVTDASDCDDTAAASYPGADEVCDEADNDCDGDVDEDATDAVTYYTDADSDGFGDAATAVSSCTQPDGTVTDGSDCDDAAAGSYPAADEVCDDADNDCDESIDEDATDASTFYADADNDTHGDASVTKDACTQPTGFVASSDDCDDSASQTYPGADEICDEADNDCDEAVDEDAIDQKTWYFDGDGDDYGTDVTEQACKQPKKYGANTGDCDDSDAEVNPGASEICDGDDEDCVDGADNGFDLDGDGVARCCEAGDYVLYYPQSTPAPIKRIGGNRMPRYNNGSFGPAVDIISGDDDIRIMGYANVLSNDHEENDILWYKVTEDPQHTYATTCLDGEWQTQDLGEKVGHARSWADVNEDDKLDYVYYEGCCNQTTSSGGSRSPEGHTYLGDGDGGFADYSGANWDVAYANNQWAGAFPISLGDWNGDGHDDILHWAVSSGGSSSSSVWFLAGDGKGNFANEVKLENLAAAGGYGDMGDIDGDGCDDFLSGANDDSGPKGKIRAMLGNCSGGVKGQVDIADQAAFAASAGGGIYGDGYSVLYDADDDGDLDLFSTYNRSSSSQRGPVLYWANDGAGTFGEGSGVPTDVVVPVSANKYYITLFVPVEQD